MDYDKFNSILAAYDRPAKAFIASIATAKAAVEFTEAVIAELTSQRNALGGEITHEAAAERQRLNMRINAEKVKLDQRQKALAMALGATDELTTEVAEATLRQ